MRRSRWFLIAVFVVVSSMLMWACGGDDQEEPGPTGEPAATRASGETPEAGTTPEAGVDTGQFAELAGQFKNATFKVTYDVGGSAAREGVEGTMVWYKKGDNLRIDISGTFEGEKMNAVLITRPDQSYFCTDAPEMGEGGSCFATPGEAGGGAGEIIGGLEEALSDPEADIVGTESREIAGEGAECFTMRSPGSDGESEVCLSNDGVPLLSKSELAEGDMVLEATDFSRDVSDSDFEPPYPVSEDIPVVPDQEQ